MLHLCDRVFIVMRSCVHECVHMYRWMRMHACVYARVCVCVCMCVCVCVQSERKTELIQNK